MLDWLVPTNLHQCIMTKRQPVYAVCRFQVPRHHHHPSEHGTKQVYTLTFFEATHVLTVQGRMSTVGLMHIYLRFILCSCFDYIFIVIAIVLRTVHLLLFLSHQPKTFSIVTSASSAATSPRTNIERTNRLGVLPSNIVFA